MAVFTAEVLVRFSLDDSLVKDINPSCDIKCDICKEGEWGGAIYLSSTYWEFVCGARLCSDCSAVIEATMDELASLPVSKLMREESWGEEMSMPLSLATDVVKYINCTEAEWKADQNWHDRVWDLRCKLKELLESDEYVESPEMEAELVDEVLNLVLLWRLDNRGCLIHEDKKRDSSEIS